MKRSFLRFFLICLATLPLSGFSADPQLDFVTERDKFCDDTFAYICQDAGKVLNAYRKERVELSEKAMAQTLKQVGADLGRIGKELARLVVDATDTTKKKNLSIDADEIPQFFKGLKVYLRQLEELSPLKKTQIDEAVEKIRKQHLDRIDKEPSFTREDKTAMKLAVTKVKVLSFQELFSFYEEQGIDWKRDANSAMEIYSGTVNSFGADLLANNASMKTFSIKKTYEEPGGKSKEVVEDYSAIFISPGAIFSMAVRGAKEPAVLSSTIAHEFGHAYDAGKFPKAYEKMNACFATEFKASPEMIWSKLDGKAATTALSRNLLEFIADTSAAEVIGRSLEAEGISGTLRGIQTLKTNLQAYCEEKAGRYPSGKFRIETAYGANPMLRKIIGCKAKNLEPLTCTLEGRYPVK